MNGLMDAPIESDKCDAGSHTVTWFESGSDGSNDEITQRLTESMQQQIVVD